MIEMKADEEFKKLNSSSYARFSFKLKLKISSEAINRINLRQQVCAEVLRMSDLDRMKERCEDDWRKIPDIIKVHC